nr:hypothetical protein [Evansella caseinilytica]
MERKDEAVFLLLFLAALFVLFYQVEGLPDHPYFMTATFLLALSIGIFFIYLPRMTKTWFQRLVVVNIAVILFIPIVEGQKWLWFSVLYYLLLSFLFIARAIFLQRKRNRGKQ